MFTVRALPGLPPYGPPARSFPKPNAFREGLVVEFVTEVGERWVGNFETGIGGPTAILAELGPSAVVVVADGAGYVVDANEMKLVREMADDIKYIRYVPELQAMVGSNGLWFEAFDAHSLIWRSRRLSWDGIRRVSCSNGDITGEAFDPISMTWPTFRINLASGEVVGGSYTGPPM